MTPDFRLALSNRITLPSHLAPVINPVSPRERGGDDATSRVCPQPDAEQQHQTELDPGLRMSCTMFDAAR